MTLLDGSLATAAANALAKLSPGELVERVQAALAAFTSATRLYDVDIEGVSESLTVEAFAYTESISSISELNLLLLSTDANLSVHEWLQQPCRLRVRLADGSDTQIVGLIRSAQCMAAEGGLARYQVSVVSWWWQLTQQSRSRVFQGKSVLQIVEQVFAGHTRSSWQLSDEVRSYVDALPNSLRPYTVQYRETDWDFITRLLAEVGLGIRSDATADAAAGALLIFADSRQWPEDITSTADGGIRFHRGHSQETADAIQAFGQRAQSVSSTSTTLGYQPLTKRAVAAQQASTQFADGSALTKVSNPAATREHYGYATRHASNAEAEFAMRLARQATEAQARQWLGRGTARTLRAGTWFNLMQSTLDDHQLSLFTQRGLRPEFGVLTIEQAGINNLPKPTQQSLTVLFGNASHALHETHFHSARQHVDAADSAFNTELMNDVELLAAAQSTGFACRFLALHREQLWTPRFQHRPASPGPLTATVTGPGGTLSANGSDELWMDAQGRIQVRFQWQQGETADDTNTVWLRVKQQQSGGGLGLQVMPRIGHEVWVDFVQGDIDCPIVMGSVYNGRGEAGHAPTPAGQQQAALTTDQSSLERSRDQAPAAQANLAGGNSPAWHGGGITQQRNAAALTGFKDAALGAGNSGFNQLVLDDSDQQLRTQLRSSQLGSELQLGHLVHQADNHRGSFKGTGVELRTDGYIALRGTQGVLLTTFGTTPSQTPTGDLAPALALAKQADGLLNTFAQAANTHQALVPAALMGSTAKQRSVVNDKASPWPALQVSLKGMVSQQRLDNALSDASKRSTAVSSQRLPHLADPLIVTAAKANHLSITGQSHVEAIGDSVHLATGSDHVSQQGGHALRHTGQALSVLAGVIKPGDNNLGLQAIAANDPLTVQAQASTIKVLAQQALQMSSKNSSVTLAAPKAIHLKTQAGARLSLIDGNIEVHAPGTLTLKRAVSKQLAGESVTYPLPQMPATAIVDVPVKFNFVLQDVPGPHGEPLANVEWRVVQAQDSTRALHSQNTILSGTSDSSGKLILSATDEKVLHSTWNQAPGQLFIIGEGQVHQLAITIDRGEWTDHQMKHHALSAMGYADRLYVAQGATVADFHAPLAISETKLPTGTALLNKLK